ncbi:carbon starvation protein CstA [Clostridiales bacterium PH28_bin88]|nr:carbon starvation protein CstA [Clostridiales bacterium PH28_bin88]
MNVLWLLVIAVPWFLLALKFYGGYIAKVFDENDNNPTPAKAMADGVDYVPTKVGVVFSHHFASIAGAGPILGPVAALMYGYVPAYLWVIFGGVFFGAVQDYTSLFVSLREKGKSMAEVAHTSLGKAGFIMFILFTLAMIVLVTSAFLGLTATALTSLVPLTTMGVQGGATVLKTVTKDGVEFAKIGGIASTSVIIMTLFAPILGYLLYKKGIDTRLAGLLAVVVALLSISIGVSSPVMFQPKTWMIIISIYVFFAAGIPVWVILQPRDFTNSFILYLGIATLFIGAVGAGFSGLQMQAPAWNVAQGTAKLGLIWPFLFITIACGAISGFHTLVSSGTVSKQISKESDARKVGYGGMLLESTLSVVVIIAVGAGLLFTNYADIVYPAKGAANPILAFALGMGGLLNKGLGVPVSFGTVFGILMLEGFVVTTLDTAVRLNRYLFEELWGLLFKNPHPILKSYYFNAGLSVIIMFYLGYSNQFKVIWPIFGSANQLLAALALIAVTMWLAARGKPTLFTLLPAIFMMATTLFALWKLLITVYIPKGNIPLAITDILLLVLSIGVIILSAKKLLEYSTGKKPAAHA